MHARASRCHVSVNRTKNEKTHIRELHAKNQMRTDSEAGGRINNFKRFFGRIFIRGRAIDREKTGAYAI